MTSIPKRNSGSPQETRNSGFPLFFVCFLQALPCSICDYIYSYILIPLRLESSLGQDPRLIRRVPCRCCTFTERKNIHAYSLHGVCEEEAERSAHFLPTSSWECSAEEMVHTGLYHYSQTQKPLACTEGPDEPLSYEMEL